MKKGSLYLILAAGLFISSCKKNDNNTSTTQPQLSYQLTTTNSSTGLAQKGTANANIQWTSGYAYPRTIKFEAKKDGVTAEFTSTTDQQIDLMASVAASFGNFTIPAGTYDEIELKIDLDKKAADPAMELEGTFSNNVTTIPVKLEIDNYLELKTENQNVTISNNDSYVAVTTIDLSSITSGISETMLLNADLTNGTIVISSHSNELLYHTILENLGNRHFHCDFEHHGH